MLNAFLICWAVGLAITVAAQFAKPEAFLRGLQEGRWGGTIFYFVATSLTFGVILWAIYSVGAWLVGLFG